MTNKPFVKICGITREQDLKAVVNSGVDAVGFIAFPKSPRYISAENLKTLLSATDVSNILKVGVFVNASKEEVERYLEAGIDVIQLHGDESEEFAQSFSTPIWRALRLKDKAQIEHFKNFPCEKFLVDSYVEGAKIPGGTGHVGDWSLAKDLIDAVGKDVLLAGGLKASNLGDAYKQVNPFGFDLSSGVEVSPGIKSQEKITELLDSLKAIS